MKSSPNIVEEDIINMRQILNVYTLSDLLYLCMGKIVSSHSISFPVFWERHNLAQIHIRKAKTVLQVMEIAMYPFLNIVWKYPPGKIRFWTLCDLPVEAGRSRGPDTAPFWKTIPTFQYLSCKSRTSSQCPPFIGFFTSYTWTFSRGVETPPTSCNDGTRVQITATAELASITDSTDPSRQRNMSWSRFSYKG